LPPGAENAGKPGYYTVRPGDSLIRIGLETGQNWRDLARWNQLENPNRLEVGQVLRVVPPVAGSTAPVVSAASSAPSAPVGAPAGVSTSAVSSSSVVGQPLPAAGTAPASSAPVATAAPTPAVVAPAPAPVPKSDPDDLGFIWPAPGAVIAGFDDQKNKGLGIAGKAGEPVLAAADGKVVYAGSGLRGYGNLVILKHNNTFLTAYAHNQTLLVKEDQTVRQGQRIAEMGSSDADRVKLHFEIRRNGKPVDPAKLLPAR
jgi:lipoprotein NlpD